MKEVTVNRDQLIETLEDNFERHKRDYAEAKEGYQEQALAAVDQKFQKAKKQLEDNFELIRKKIRDLDPNDPEPIRDIITLIHTVSMSLAVPQNHSYDYEMAIQMAKMEVNETITLTQDEFQCLVMDDWEWRREFEATKMSYSQS